ncbi:hypothetical protein SAMN04488511_11610 [Pedobacter suwonensis]|uniref:Uncharacterized protein n=1 Tax=Pedobacter suwonensis TaxID=332999 RepID=A0A1I0TXK5_9SPHI|nr:hypothetical protein [Pedobacter suwonensis]SFA56465.1 hypothetical protein SAMN04488511_11610 [Pedobacter suwonensis]
MEKAFEKETLMGALSNWSRQEHQFRELFSDGALRDRSFQRMKLDEYDRLYYKFQGKALPVDERAMMLMLRYERTRIRRQLYPGLLRRTVHRIAAAVKAAIARRREQRAAQFDPPDFRWPELHRPQPRNDPGQRHSKRNIPTLRHRPPRPQKNKSHGMKP